MAKQCFYCEKTYKKNTEHVFPDGLGGQQIFMSCVCLKCNNEFSMLERELYQKGIAALMRSIEGISNKKKQNKPNYFKAPTLLTLDEENKIVYEVNQNNEFEISLKPQIIEIDSKLYLEGSINKDIEKFINKIKKWTTNSLTMIYSLSNEHSKETSYVQFQIKTNEIISEKIKTSEKVKASLIFQKSGNNKLSKFLKPRIFLDNNDSLRIRANSIQESIDFIKKLLIFIPKNIKLNSYNEVINDNGIILVGHYFDPLKNEQAMVKIILNCLIHYFPNSKSNSSLEKIKTFIKHGESTLKRSLEKKSNIIDSNDKTHNLFFYQYEKNVSIRLSLFNGQICYSIIIEDLQILPNMDYKRLIIDYKNRINRMESKNEFFNSFNVKR